MGVETTTSVNWLTLVASSAVVSAVVNVGWNAWAKMLDRKREDAKDAKRIGHVYLDIALQLEGFAKGCDAYLYDIDNALWERGNSHDETNVKQLKRIPLKFDPEPNWTELPIPFVAQLKALPGQFSSTESWILEQWEIWADTDDAYRLEEQSVSYYGIKALDVADAIRGDIQAGSGETAAMREHFLSEIESRRKAYALNRNAVTLIPELEAMFKAEFPESPDEAKVVDENDE